MPQSPLQHLIQWLCRTFRILLLFYKHHTALFFTFLKHEITYGAFAEIMTFPVAFIQRFAALCTNKISAFPSYETTENFFTISCCFFPCHHNIQPFLSFFTFFTLYKYYIIFFNKNKIVIIKLALWIILWYNKKNEKE